MLRQKDFPKILHIGDDVWEIRFCREIPDQPGNVLGLCDPSTFTIYILQKQKPKERFKTLIHEAAHAVSFTYDLKENHSLIYKLEDIIYDFLVQNIFCSETEEGK